MKLKFLAAAFLAVAFVSAKPQSAAKAVDACAPPPSAVAPSLPAKLMEGQGIVHFPITTKSPEAQKFFDQGIAQMHSFWAREAERSFLQAAALDPEAPMPWFGIALVAGGDWRPRFQIDQMVAFFGKPVPSSGNTPNRSRAYEAARKANELAKVDGKATDLERLYIHASSALRDDTEKDRYDAFVRELRVLLAKYPKEVEARTYLALMVMRGFTLPDKKPRTAGTTEAVEILKQLLVEVPDHPGVHHYVIHGWEGSTFAKDAWPSCKRYSELVTNIPHALHMPGHIYSQTGRWADAIKSFDDAAVNERGYMSADRFYGNGHHGHNVHYLATSYSFSGEYDKALVAAKELLAIPENPRESSQPDNVFTAYAQGWFALMRTMVQFGKWDEITSADTLPQVSRPRQQAWRHWALAVAYANKGNVENALAESRAMDESLNTYREKVKLPVPEELQVARKELDGHLAVAQKNVKRGLKLLQAAADGERKLRYSEPPYYPRPVLEVVGQVALKNGKDDVAAKAFRGALEQYPADHHAELGLKAATGKNSLAVAAGQ